MARSFQVQYAAVYVPGDTLRVVRRTARSKPNKVNKKMNYVYTLYCVQSTILCMVQRILKFKG